jgi:hypothetical protein
MSPAPWCAHALKRTHCRGRFSVARKSWSRSWEVHLVVRPPHSFTCKVIECMLTTSPELVFHSAGVKKTDWPKDEPTQYRGYAQPHRYPLRRARFLSQNETRAAPSLSCGWRTQSQHARTRQRVSGNRHTGKLGTSSLRIGRNMRLLDIAWRFSLSINRCRLGALWFT